MSSPDAATTTTPRPPGCIDDDSVAENCGFISATNRVVYTQTVFAVIAVLASLAVIAVIYGHNKDRRDLRHRILLHLFLSNLLFSVGNAPPTYLLSQPLPTVEYYTFQTMSLVTACHFEGVFFAGKYWMALVEIFIVAVSIVALRTHSANIPPRFEAVAHLVCPVVGIAVGIHYSVECVSIHEAWASAENHDEDTAVDATRYNGLFTGLIDGWLGLFGVVLVLWLYQRLCLHRLLEQWDDARIEAEQEVEAVFNVEARALLLNTKRALLHATKDAYNEVAMPLEPYIAIFVAFSVPAIVPATTPCEDQTSRHLTVGCQHVCQMLLALRPIATAAVFFGTGSAGKQNREQLLSGVDLARRVWLRLRNFAWWAVGQREVTGGGDRVRFNPELEQVSGDRNDGGGDGGGDVLAPSVPYELMSGH